MEVTMPRFNHAVTLAFSVISNDVNGNDITEDMLREAMDRRAYQLTVSNEWCEACLPPFDTYEEEDKP
jgi:hypothetical protein